jgi:hypothetical protein
LQEFRSHRSKALQREKEMPPESKNRKSWQLRRRRIAIHSLNPELLNPVFQSFPAFMAGVVVAANDGVQERAQDGHSALDQKKRFYPEAGTMGEHAEEESHRDGKNHKQPNVIEDSDEFSVGHMQGGTFFPERLDHGRSPKFKIDFRLLAVSANRG